MSELDWANPMLGFKQLSTMVALSMNLEIVMETLGADLNMVKVEVVGIAVVSVRLIECK
jgi:hypothetical protein